MERSRGSSRGRGSFRGASNSQSRSFSNHHSSSSSSHQNDWHRSNGGSYNSGYDSRSMHNGAKRKYETSQHDDLRKTLHHSSDHHERKSYHHDDHPRKHFRPESGHHHHHHHESRSHHHRSDYDYETMRSVTYRDNPPSHHHHHRYGDDDRSMKRHSHSYSSGHSSHHHHRGISSHRGRGSHSGYVHKSKRDESSESPSTRDASDDVAGSPAPSNDLKAEVKQQSPEKAPLAENRKIKSEPEELDQGDDVLTLTEEDRAAEEDDETGSHGEETEPKQENVAAEVEAETQHAESDSHSKNETNEENRNRSKGGRSESPRRKHPGNSSHDPPEHYIRLQCPHCHQRAVTFREYISHLSTTRHAESLRKISVQHRLSLAKLRTRQRKEQKQMEAQSSRPPHSTRMNFCAICKLYHSESRPNHETTELHKIIKNFLMPYCPICRVSFKSRMLYEKHVATLTHIKNKDNMEKTYERRRSEEQKRRDAEKSQAAANTSAHDASGHGDDDEVDDLNLDNFMILDAVGSDADGDPLEDTPVGQQWLKRVEVLYCDVCQRYLHRTEGDLDKVAELHCRSRVHHQATEEREQEADEEHDNEAEPESNGVKEEMKRSASEERLLEEAGQDIGDLDEGMHVAEGQNDEQNNNDEVNGEDGEERELHQDETS